MSDAQELMSESASKPYMPDDTGVSYETTHRNGLHWKNATGSALADEAFAEPASAEILEDILTVVRGLEQSQLRLETSIREVAEMLSDEQSSRFIRHPSNNGNDAPRRASFAETGGRRSLRYSKDRPLRLFDTMCEGAEDRDQPRIMHGETVGFFNSLPSRWPASLEMRPFCAGTRDMDYRTRTLFEKIISHSEKGSRKNAGSKASSARVDASGFVLHPAGHICKVNDAASFLFVMLDVLVAPSILAWELNSEGLLLVLLWASAVYWTICLLLGFVTGFYIGGEIVMKQPQVVVNFLKTGFLMDFIVLLGDFTSLIANQDDSQGTKQILRLVKFLRLLKIMRLLRLMRIFDKIATNTLSPGVRMLSQILQMFFVTVLTIHILSCLWIFVGRRGPTDTGQRWLPEFEQAQMDCQAGCAYGRWYIYLTAFHWTAAQLTLGSTSVVPVNTLERLITIACLIAGLLFGASIVAFLSAQIVQFIMTRMDKMQMLDDVRRFLRQSQVNSALAIRVTKSVRERLLEEHALGEDDVDGLALLSGKLRSELAFQIRRPHILKHALFRLWAQIEDISVEELCRHAVDFQFLFPRDVLFRPAQALEQAFYVVSGSLIYVQVPETSRVDDINEVTVLQGSWVAEAALWSKWQHVGKLEAVSECQILVIRLDGMMKVLEGETDLRRAISHATRNYARNFCTRLAGLKPPTPWPSDVSLSFADSPDLMAHDVSKGLLRRVMRESLEAERVAELEQEVENDLCVLRENADGVVERVVFLVSFRIEDEGDTLTKLGVRRKDGLLEKSKLELPGTKRKRDEPTDQARCQALSKLGILAKHIEILSELEDIWEETSQAFHVPTQYRRAVNIARLKSKRQEIDQAMHNEAHVEESRKSSVINVIKSSKSLLSNPSKTFKKFDLRNLQEDIPMVYAIPKSEPGEVTFYAWLSQETRDRLLADESLWEKYLESLADPESLMKQERCYRI